MTSNLPYRADIWTYQTEIEKIRHRHRATIKTPVTNPRPEEAIYNGIIKVINRVAGVPGASSPTSDGA